MKKQTNETENIFGDVIDSYTDEQGIEDGFLMKNPRRETFEECSIITTNLLTKLENLAEERNKERVFSEIDTNYLVGCLMLLGKDIYENEKFEGDNDKDFFVTPKTEEGLVVWFVRNGQNKLTAMLPEDY